MEMEKKFSLFLLLHAVFLNDNNTSSFFSSTKEKKWKNCCSRKYCGLSWVVFFSRSETRGIPANEIFLLLLLPDRTTFKKTIFFLFFSFFFFCSY